jgi:Na+/pantothenate symporter
MGRILKIAALVLGLTGLVVLAFFGFAIWVFIPLLPAGIVYLVALATAKRTPALRERSPDSDHKKAA